MEICQQDPTGMIQEKHHSAPFPDLDENGGEFHWLFGFVILVVRDWTSCDEWRFSKRTQCFRESRQFLKQNGLMIATVYWSQDVFELI
jgi:hypothetical protein